MAESKAKSIEEVGVADRLTTVEAHPSQTDASKSAPDKPEAEEVTGQELAKDKGK